MGHTTWASTRMPVTAIHIFRNAQHVVLTETLFSRNVVFFFGVFFFPPSILCQEKSTATTKTAFWVPIKIDYFLTIPRSRLSWLYRLLRALQLKNPIAEKNTAPGNGNLPRFKICFPNHQRSSGLIKQIEDLALTRTKPGGWFRKEGLSVPALANPQD